MQPIEPHVIVATSRHDWFQQRGVQREQIAIQINLGGCTRGMRSHVLVGCLCTSGLDEGTISRLARVMVGEWASALL